MTDNNCIFCKITQGEIPCTKVYENSELIAFNDINPVAEIHVLIVPKNHVENLWKLSGLPDKGASILTEVASAADEISDKLGLKGDEGGFRLVNNCGPLGGQTVPHLHFHLISDKEALSEKVM